MKSYMFKQCCRLCLDEAKPQVEIYSVDRLAKTLTELYNLKIEKDDRCSKMICIQCMDEANEFRKWFKFHETQKKIIQTNQEIFQDILLEQLGPEVSPSSKNNSTVSTRAERLTRRSQLNESKSRKKKKIVTRSRAARKNSAGDTVSEATSEEESDVAMVGDDEEEASETATTSTDEEIKCPKCTKLFNDLESLEKHQCKFVCSICSSSISTRTNMKRHIVRVHKIADSQWQNYWHFDGDTGDQQNLLVETQKPKKRYRYESDSPTDIEEEEDASSGGGSGASNGGRVNGGGASANTNNDVGSGSNNVVVHTRRSPVPIVCQHCELRFDTEEEKRTHDCEYACNICGSTFVRRHSVKRHKINVHKMDKNDPSLVSTPRASGNGTMRARSKSVCSRPPSRAPSVSPQSEAEDDENEGPTVRSYRYNCMLCKYSNTKRQRTCVHLNTVHSITEAEYAEHIDRETVFRSKTPMRSMTPAPDFGYRRSLGSDRKPFVRAKSVARDEHDDIVLKRKRSNSVCASKFSRTERAKSIPPGMMDRQPTTGPLPLPDTDVFDNLSRKLRATLTNIDNNRLTCSITAGCEQSILNPEPMRIRASSYVAPEPPSIRKLFKLKPPTAAERKRASDLRSAFLKLTNRISSISQVNAIEMDSLVLYPSAAEVSADISGGPEHFESTDAPNPEEERQLLPSEEAGHGREIPENQTNGDASHSATTDAVDTNGGVTGEDTSQAALDSSTNMSLAQGERSQIQNAEPVPQQLHPHHHHHRHQQQQQQQHQQLHVPMEVDEDRKPPPESCLPVPPVEQHTAAEEMTGNLPDMTSMSMDVPEMNEPEEIMGD